MVSSVASVSRVENSCAVCCSQMALRSKFGMSLMLLESGCWAAADQRHSLHAHDNFCVLIQNFGQGPHYAAIRFGLGALALENGGSQAQPVAGANRAQPAQLIDAGRSEARSLRQVVIDKHAHHQSAGVPAAGNEAAEGSARRGFGIDMKILRVEAFCELDDFGFFYLRGSEFLDGSRDVVFEIAGRVRHRALDAGNQLPDAGSQCLRAATMSAVNCS